MVFGITTESSSEKFSVKNLDADEHIVELYHRTISAQRGPLKRHLPYDTPKEWRKNPTWKNVKEHFYALTNKRWLFVNYKNREIIESYDLRECDVLPGTGSITFMRGTERSFQVDLGDNMGIFQIIKHVQSSLKGTDDQKVVSTLPPKEPSEDPLSILKMRLVKGEISKEEYEEMKSVLEE